MWSCGTLLFLTAAQAAPPDPARVADRAVAAATANVTARAAQLPWIERFRPVRNTWELGLYSGVWSPSARHEFYQPNLAVAGYGHQPLARAGADIGLRVGYYPLSFVGIELEGGVIPTKAADGQRATLYTLRPMVQAQLPYRISPFMRAGLGLVGISSAVLGKDVDTSLNLGGGVKFRVNHRVALRLDVVDNITTAFGVGKARTNNVEALFGLSVRLGKAKAKARLVAPALVVIDSDGDGLRDPKQVGVLQADEDMCPKQPGPPTNGGCPWTDGDDDGILDVVDMCPVQPETVNQIDDLDGCPDSVPPVQK